MIFTLRLMLRLSIFRLGFWSVYVGSLGIGWTVWSPVIFALFVLCLNDGFLNVLGNCLAEYS